MEVQGWLLKLIRKMGEKKGAQENALFINTNGRAQKQIGRLMAPEAKKESSFNSKTINQKCNNKWAIFWKVALPRKIVTRKTEKKGGQLARRKMTFFNQPSKTKKREGQCPIS